MKRILAIFMLTALLLTSCGETPVDIPKMDYNALPHDSDIVIEIEEREGDPEANYLADPMFDTTEYLPGYDYNIGFSIGGNNSFEGFCETAEAYYFISRANHHIPILTFLDKKTQSQWPLCFRPECTHDGYDCGAYTNCIDAPSVYDGRLWWISVENDYKELNVYSCALDGTDRRLVMKTDAMEWTKGINSNEISFKSMFHRGYLYLCFTRTALVNAVTTAHIFVLKTPISGDGKTEAIINTQTHSDYANITAVARGNKLWFSIDAYNYSGDDWAMSLSEYDTKTGALDVLLSVSTSAYERPVNSSCFGVSPNGDLLFGRRGRILRFDPESGGFEDVYSFADSGYAEQYFGQDRILLISEDILTTDGIMRYKTVDYGFNTLCESEFNVLKDFELPELPFEIETANIYPFAMGAGETLWNVWYNGQGGDGRNLSCIAYIGVPFGEPSRMYSMNSSWGNL